MTDNEIYFKFAKMLAQARVDANKSQKQMADLVGVSLRTIQHWEGYTTMPDPVHIIKWFKVLHANIFLYYAKEFSIDNPLDDILTVIILSLPAETKEDLYHLDKNYGIKNLIDLRKKEIEVLNEK